MWQEPFRGGPITDLERSIKRPAEQQVVALWQLNAGVATTNPAVSVPNGEPALLCRSRVSREDVEHGRERLWLEVALVGNRARPCGGIHVVLVRSNANEGVKLHQSVRDLAGGRGDRAPANMFVGGIGRMQDPRVRLEAGRNHAAHARRKRTQSRSDPRRRAQVVSLGEAVV